MEIIETKEYVENIIGSMIDTVFVLSPKWIVEKVNRPDVLGYTETEMIGLSIGKLCAEETSLLLALQALIKKR